MTTASRLRARTQRLLQPSDCCRAFKGAVEDAGIVGGSLLVVKGGQVLTHETVGYQDLDAKTPTAPTTIYHWASITKTFTGIAIMQLRDRGLLSLDDSGRQVRAGAAGSCTTRSATSRR